MSDITERLAEQQTKYMCPILGEAATEIKRLRLALLKINQRAQKAKGMSFCDEAFDLSSHALVETHKS